MNYLSDNYPERKMDLGLVEHYFHDLKHAEVTLDEFKMAALYHVATATHFPYVAELLTIIKNVKR